MLVTHLLQDALPHRRVKYRLRRDRRTGASRCEGDCVSTMAILQRKMTLDSRASATEASLPRRRALPKCLINFQTRRPVNFPKTCPNNSSGSH